jgi:hypothetical protein
MVDDRVPACQQQFEQQTNIPFILYDEDPDHFFFRSHCGRVLFGEE